ncbi:MAG: DUF4142 domain-containing protein [Caulobacteraceae bacterium]
MQRISIAAAAATAFVGAALAPPALAAPAHTLNDAQIANIAYTADSLDIAQAKQALQKSHETAVRSFAEEMVRDHTAVNRQALALVKQLHVTPQDNPTSQALTAASDKERQTLAGLSGHAYDVAYAKNEVAYHKTVNAALASTLIPDARNPKLKALLETGLKLFRMHEQHAEQLVASLTRSAR